MGSGTRIRDKLNTDPRSGSRGPKEELNPGSATQVQCRTLKMWLPNRTDCTYRISSDMKFRTPTKPERY
jgi:hypothetical protein